MDSDVNPYTIEQTLSVISYITGQLQSSTLASAESDALVRTQVQAVTPPLPSQTFPPPTLPQLALPQPTLPQPTTLPQLTLPQPTLPLPSLPQQTPPPPTQATKKMEVGESKSAGEDKYCPLTAGEREIICSLIKNAGEEKDISLNLGGTKYVVNEVPDQDKYVILIIGKGVRLSELKRSDVFGTEESRQGSVTADEITVGRDTPVSVESSDANIHYGQQFALPQESQIPTDSQIPSDSLKTEQAVSDPFDVGNNSDLPEPVKDLFMKMERENPANLAGTTVEYEGMTYVWSAYLDSKEQDSAVVPEYIPDSAELPMYEEEVIPETECVPEQDILSPSDNRVKDEDAEAADTLMQYSSHAVVQSNGDVLPNSNASETLRLWVDDTYEDLIIEGNLPDELDFETMNLILEQSTLAQQTSGDVTVQRNGGDYVITRSCEDVAQGNVAQTISYGVSSRRSNTNSPLAKRVVTLVDANRLPTVPITSKVEVMSRTVCQKRKMEDIMREKKYKQPTSQKPGGTVIDPQDIVRVTPVNSEPVNESEKEVIKTGPLITKVSENNDEMIDEKENHVKINQPVNTSNFSNANEKMFSSRGLIKSKQLMSHVNYTSQKEHIVGHEDSDFEFELSDTSEYPALDDFEDEFLDFDFIGDENSSTSNKQNSTFIKPSTDFKTKKVLTKIKTKHGFPQHEEIVSVNTEFAASDIQDSAQPVKVMGGTTLADGTLSASLIKMKGSSGKKLKHTPPKPKKKKVPTATLR